MKFYWKCFERRRCQRTLLNTHKQIERRPQIILMAIDERSGRKDKYSRVKPSRSSMTWHDVNEQFLSFDLVFTGFISLPFVFNFVSSFQCNCRRYYESEENYWLQFNCCCKLKLKKKLRDMKNENKQTNQRTNAKHLVAV